MRYKLTINQAAIIQYNEQMNCSLDIKDAHIIALFISLIKDGNLTKKNGYYKLNYKIVMNEPLLGLKNKHSVFKRYNKLISAKILEPMQESNGGNSLQYFKMNHIKELCFYDRKTDFTGVNQRKTPSAEPLTSVNKKCLPALTKPLTSVNTNNNNNNNNNKEKNNNNDIDFFVEIMNYYKNNPSEEKKLKLDIPLAICVEYFINHNLENYPRKFKYDPIKHTKDNLLSFVLNSRELPDKTYPEDKNDESQYSDIIVEKMERA